MSAVRRAGRLAKSVLRDLRDRAYVARRRLPIRELLPNLVVLGAQKCGTSSLHFYLGQHPHVFMSDLKETNLFLPDSDAIGAYHRLEPEFYGSSDREKRRGLGDAQILRRMLRGYAGQPIIGDSSTYYTMAPTSGLEVPERLRALQPDAKLVYLVRNPFERIVSNYEHDVAIRARAGRPIQAGLDEHVRSRSHFLDISRYHYQLSRFLPHFDRDQVLVLVFEEFVREPQRALDRVLRFLGLAVGFRFDTARVHNPSGRDAARRRPALRFARETYEAIAAPLREDVAALEALLARDLRLWDLSPERWCEGCGE